MWISNVNNNQQKGELKMAGKQDEFSSPYADKLFGKTAADKEIAESRDTSLKFKPGETKVIRMVSPKVEVKLHWKVLPNAGRIVCRKTLGKDEDCPICSYLEQIRAKDGWATWRCYTQVIDYTDERAKQWNFSFATKEAIFDAVRNNGQVSAEIPLTKFKIQVERIGEGLDTVYKVTIAKKPTDITEEEKALIAKIKPIEEEFKVLTVAELRGLITGESTPVVKEDIAEVQTTVPASEAQPKEKKELEDKIEDEDLF